MKVERQCCWLTKRSLGCAADSMLLGPDRAAGIAWAVAADLSLSFWASSSSFWASREVSRRRDMLSTPSAWSLLRLKPCCSWAEASAPSWAARMTLMTPSRAAMAFRKPSTRCRRFLAPSQAYRARRSTTWHLQGQQPTLRQGLCMHDSSKS